MENPKLVLIFHLDTLELDIDAPELSMDFCLSMLDRAVRMLERQEKLDIATQMRQGVARHIRLQ